MGKLSRRQFIQRSAAVGIGGGLASFIPGCSHAETSRLADEIPRRVLGKTGEKVSMICLGGYHFVVAEREEGEAAAIRLIHKGIDLGVNFIDSAWDYGNGRSEEIIGNALTEGRRNRVFLMTKHHGRTPDVAQQHLEDSLRRMKTDHLDLWQFHTLSEIETVDKIFAAGGAIEYVLKAQEEGKVRYIGLTGHFNPKVQEHVLDNYAHHLDTMQFPINCADPHFKSFVNTVVPKAAEKNIGILAMKTMAFGNLVTQNITSPADCLRFAWSQPISAIVSGIDKEEYLDENLNAARTFTPMTESENKQLVASTKDKAGIEVEDYKDDRT